MDMRILAPPPRGPFTISLALAALLAISACGFKLRGPVELPPEIGSLFVQAQPGSEVRDEIVRQLQGSQVQLADQPEHSCAIIRIGDERRSSRVIAVDRNNKVLARMLDYRLTFEIVTADGTQLIPQQTLELSRSYENPDIEVLGKQLEAELIYADMLTDAANQILNRLRFTFRNQARSDQTGAQE